MKIIEKRYAAVEMEDDHRYRSTVVKQSDGRWKCLRCQRYRCEHALFVKRENPRLPALPPASDEDAVELI